MSCYHHYTAIAAIHHSHRTLVDTHTRLPSPSSSACALLVACLTSKTSWAAGSPGSHQSRTRPFNRSVSRRVHYGVCILSVFLWLAPPMIGAVWLGFQRWCLCAPGCVTSLSCAYMSFAQYVLLLLLLTLLLPLLLPLHSNRAACSSLTASAVCGATLTRQQAHTLSLVLSCRWRRR